MDENIQKLQQMIDESPRIVFFGGAGVSTESGIPDFRFLGRHGADFVLLYKRCNRPNDCNYRICDLFCDLFFRKKVERITGRIGFDRLYFL